MGNAVEYGIRINVTGNQAAADAVDTLATSTDNLTTAAEKAGRSMGVVNGQMNDTAAIMRANAEATSLASDAAQKFLAPLQKEIDLFGASRAEVEQYKAARAGLTAVVQQQAAAMGAALDAMQREEQEARQLAAVHDQATKSAEQFLNKLKDQVATLGMNTAQLQAYRAAQLGVSEAAAPLIERIDAASKSTDKHTISLNSNMAKVELIRAANDALTGQYTRMESAVMTLANRTGASATIFSTLALGIAAAVAPLAIFSVAALQAHGEVTELNNALAFTNNYAGQTAETIAAMADRIASGGQVTLGTAKQIVTTYAESGKIGSAALEQISTLTANYAKQSHQSIDDATKDLVRMFSDPKQGVQELDQKINDISATEKEYIRTLQEAGDKMGAQSEMAQVLAGHLSTQATEVTGLSKVWNDAKDAFSRYWDLIKKSTQDPSAYQAQLNAANTVLAAMYNSPISGSDSMKKQIAAQEQYIANLRAQHEAQVKADQDHTDQLNKQKDLDDAVYASTQKSITAQIAAAQKELATLNNPDAKPSDDLDERKLEVKRQLADLTRQLHAEDNATSAAEIQGALAIQEIQLKAKATAIAQSLALGNITKERYDQAMTDNQLQVIAAKKAAESQLLANADLTVAERASHEARLQQLNAEAKAAKDAGAGQLNVDTVTSYKAATSATQQLYDTELKGLTSSILQQRVHIQQLQTTRSQADLLKKQQFDADTQQMASDATFLEAAAAKAQAGSNEQALWAGMATRLREAIGLRNTWSNNQGTISGLEAQAEAIKQNTQNINEMASAAKSMAAELKGAFGGIGDAIGGLVTAWAGYAQAQDQIAARQRTAIKNATDDAQVKAANQNASDEYAQAEMKNYGDVAGAVKDLFGQHTVAYKAMQATEQAFHLASTLMAFQEMVAKVGYKTSEVAANTALNATKLTGETATTTASVANAGTEASAWGITAVVKAIASLPFPFNLAAGAATLAAVVAVGAKIAGGLGGSGSVSTSEQRQASQGTGTVLGDSSAKSDSLNKAIELTASNSSTQINYLSGLLTTLKTIQSDITSFTSELVQTTDVTGSNITGLNTNNGLASSVGTIGLTGAGAVLGATGAAWTAAAGSGIAASTLASLGAAAGPVGAIAGALVGAIASKIPAISNLMTSIFGGKQSLQDSGFTLDKATLGSVLANGVNAESYADIHTSGGLFSHSSNDEKTASLGADANRQFTSIIDSIATSITQAAGLMGVSGSAFTNQLNSFVIDIGKVSLKDLKGDDLNKAIEAVFSKLGDQMAQAAIPDLTQFQQVGEGYLDTLVRVASDYAKVDASLQSIGKTFGSVGVGSIAARESLISLMGGIDDFQSKTADYAQNFLTKAQQLAPVQAYVTQQLQSMNLGWVQTREQFAQVVAGLDLTSASGQQTYASLMNLESAFAAVTGAINDTTKSAQDIADERKDLQDQLDNLTMTPKQLSDKAKAALDESNQGLYDEVQAAQAAKDAVDTHNSALDLQSQIYALTGDKAAAAAVLQQQHTIALANTAPELQGLTQQLWNLQDAANVKTDLLSAVDTAYSNLETVIDREKDLLQQRIQDQQSIVDKQQAINDSIKSTLSQITSSVQDLAVARSQAQATIAIMQAKLASGPLSDADTDALNSAMNTLTQDSKGLFSSKEDYLFDQYTTQNQLEKLKSVSDNQLTDAQKQLQVLQAQSTALDDQLAQAKQQVDLLKGIDTTSLSILQALQAFNTSVASASANPAIATTAITNSYASALGRTPDEAGLAFWQQQAANGVPLSDINNAIANSREAQIDKLYESVLGRTADSAGLQYWYDSGASIADIEASMKSSQEYKSDIASGTVKAFAYGGDFEGGIRLVGENGPEIEATGPARYFNASQTRSIMQGASRSDNGGTADLQRAVNDLNGSMKNMHTDFNNNINNLRIETRAVASHSSKTASLLKRVIRDNTMKISTDETAESTT